MKGKNMSAVLAVILLTGVVMITGCGKSESKDSETESQVSQEETTEAEEVKSADNPITDEALDYLKSATNVTVEKVVMNCVDDGNDCKNTYEEYLISDIDLAKSTDKTEDYLKAVSAEEFDDSLIETKDFEEAFGFGYSACSNAYDLFEAALLTNGFDASYYDCTFDEENYEMTGQKKYKLNQTCGVEDSLLGDADYDKILQSYTAFNTTETADEIVIPEKFSALVQYEKDGVIYTKSVYIEISINETVEEETSESSGCCSSSDVSNETENESSDSTDNDSTCMGCGHSDMSECTSECAGKCDMMDDSE